VHKHCLLRESFVSTEVKPGQMRKVLSQICGNISHKVLWLSKGQFLVLSFKQVASIEELTTEDFLNFIGEASDELNRFMMTVCISHSKKFSLSSFLEVPFSIVRSDGAIKNAKVETEAVRSQSAAVQRFHYAVSNRLVSRPQAVRLYYDAMASDSNLSKVIGYFRTLEAGFSIKGGRLSKYIVPFLEASEFKISTDDWLELKKKRDRLAHAYDGGSISYERDAFEPAKKLMGIAADVVLHKKNWGSADIDRVDEQGLANYTKLDGSMVATQNFDFELICQVSDPVTGTPVHLQGNLINESRLRYINKAIRLLRTQQA
jgi:hypothetical protein